MGAVCMFLVPRLVVFAALKLYWVVGSLPHQKTKVKEAFFLIGRYQVFGYFSEFV